MRKSLTNILCIILLLFGSKMYAQTLSEKNIIIATNVPDNFTGRYNIGMEYLLPLKKSDNTKASISLNGGLISTNQLQKSIKGYSLILETNLYTDIMLPKNWNEFGGFKLSYGNLENQTDKTNNQTYFVGISTGIQPVIAKVICIKVSADLGYVHNGLTSSLLFTDRSQILYTGFLVDLNLGIGVRF
jgi:hypothetical protein